METKTTLTVTPECAEQLEQLPPYIRRDALLQHLGILKQGQRTTVVVKPARRLRPEILRRSLRIQMAILEVCYKLETI